MTVDQINLALENIAATLEAVKPLVTKRSKKLALDIAISERQVDQLGTAITDELKRLSSRELLPARRASETFDFDHYNQTFQSFRYKTTVSFYHDGRIGEVFLSSAKITSDMDIASRDAAILLSFALQHHVTADTIRSAMTRDAEGRPLGVIGTLLDRLCDQYQQKVD